MAFIAPKISKQWTGKGQSVRGPSGKSFVAYFEGGPELARKLKLLVDAAEGETSTVPKDALLAGGKVMEAEWRNRVKVGPPTVHYRDSISAKSAKGKKGATGTVAVRKLPGVADNEQPLNYAGRLEYGRSNQPAQPAARPAFDASKERIVETVEGVIRKAVESI